MYDFINLHNMLCTLSLEESLRTHVHPMACPSLRALINLYNYNLKLVLNSAIHYGIDNAALCTCVHVKTLQIMLTALSETSS